MSRTNGGRSGTPRCRWWVEVAGDGRPEEGRSAKLGPRRTAIRRRSTSPPVVILPEKGGGAGGGEGREGGEGEGGGEEGRRSGEEKAAEEGVGDGEGRRGRVGLEETEKIRRRKRVGGGTRRWGSLVCPYRMSSGRAVVQQPSRTSSLGGWSGGGQTESDRGK